MRLYPSVRALCGWSYNFFTGIQVLGQTMCRDTWKVIKGIQLIRLYSSVRALCGPSYTSFIGVQVLGKFGETAPKYPISYAGTHEK